MFRRPLASFIVSIVPFAAFLAACGGDSSTSPKVAELTIEQQAAIGAAYNAVATAGTYAAVAALASLNQPVSDSDSAACPGGGNLRVSYTVLASGTATNEQSTTNANFTYDNCVLSGQSRQFTIVGALAIRATLVITPTTNTASGWAVKGALTANGQNCAFDVAATEAAFTGTVCGIAASSITGISLAQRTPN